jgi:hypothetical protein
MAQITNHTEGPDQWILVNFPRMNKQHHIDDNDAEIRADIVARDSFPERCKIVRTIRLSNDEFDLFSVSMLDDRAEWFDGTGGSRSDVELLQDKSWHDISTDLGLTRMWYASSYIPVVRVMRAARQWAGPDIYVNCEGLNYARYAGRDARVNWTLASTTSQGVVPTS